MSSASACSKEDSSTNQTHPARKLSSSSIGHSQRNISAPTTISAKILGEGLFNFTKNRRAVIIGVLDDERQVSIATQSQPEIEICIPQITPDTLAYQSVEGLNMDLAIRTDRSPSSIIPELRDLMRQASPELSDSTFTTMDQVVEDSYGSQQLAARLLIVFGGSALLVCITGIYGLLAYLVAHRTKELGLRIALGAQRGDVMWLVLRQASWMLLQDRPSD